MSQTYILYLCIFFIVVYALFFFWWKSNRRKTNDTFNALDLNQESKNASIYILELLESQYSFLNKHLDGIPVDAFTVARTEFSKKSQAQDLGKNIIKGAATLGTVRFRTVHSPKYLVLSGPDLHLFDLNTNGSIHQHFIFDRYRLLNSRLVELPEKQAYWAQLRFGNYSLKSYKLELATEAHQLNFIIYNALVVINQQNRAQMSLKAETQVKQFIVGNHFLNKLETLYPNLKVYTDLPS